MLDISFCFKPHLYYGNKLLLNDKTEVSFKKKEFSYSNNNSVVRFFFLKRLKYCNDQ